jgi:hypothetical protein
VHVRPTGVVSTSIPRSTRSADEQISDVNWIEEAAKARLADLDERQTVDGCVGRGSPICLCKHCGGRRSSGRLMELSHGLRTTIDVFVEIAG